jgi:mono/diheme cytochrome c family protein
MSRTFGLLLLGLLLMVTGGVIYGQDRADCVPEYIILRQAQLSAELQDFAAQVEADSSQALDTLYNVMQGYEVLLEECNYFGALLDFDIEDIGDAANGERLFDNVYNTYFTDFAYTCSSCHTADQGISTIGPNFSGLIVTIETRLAAMTPAEIMLFTGVEADAPLQEQIRGYLFTSVVSPDVFVQQGFHDDVMPSNWAEDLSRQQILDIIAYLMTLEPTEVNE